MIQPTWWWNCTHQTTFFRELNRASVGTSFFGKLQETVSFSRNSLGSQRRFRVPLTEILQLLHTCWFCTLISHCLLVRYHLFIFFQNLQLPTFHSNVMAYSLEPTTANVNVNLCLTSCLDQLKLLARQCCWFLFSQNGDICADPAAHLPLVRCQMLESTLVGLNCTGDGILTLR